MCDSEVVLVPLAEIEGSGTEGLRSIRRPAAELDHGAATQVLDLRRGVL
jgi:hypothetical protein